ncbi:MAG: zinc metalloprotease HtpX [Candidatus Doudnabacteria bacterium CG10_big_fil_rev_8_21_14_0_10_41_10]|uniref:Protease HtpX homolog n=1 Tax=Candidatus Doudnabacteria bacterium CG10_big_fil_rev_8_21_14_0_10_41_10 TaxID=1974551 RepID=A0A2H0VFS2_9BACT|nr:MAG: zinc metalloprotease HtpX [Candidatus Doudnabacteria bacterium CG10_big_fil_rev_8_21_14_0_10_41_10]
MLTYDHIDSNKRKTAVLITAFLILIIGLGFVFSQAYDAPAFVFIAVIFSTTMSLVSYFVADKIALGLSHAKQVDRATVPELYKLVENLSIAAGLPTPKIYIIEDSAPNAFATGRKPELASVAFTTGILQKLEKKELEGVIAHELSHIGNYDIRLMTIVVVLVGILTLLADWFLRFSFFGGRRKSSNGNGGQAQIIFIFVGLALAILSPIFATILQLAISRKREFLADASGALLTRYPEGLASALEKISADHEPLEVANKATAHLYFANPLKDQKGRSTGWFKKLFNTHPPAEERISKLRGMHSSI